MLPDGSEKHFPSETEGDRGVLCRKDHGHGQSVYHVLQNCLGRGFRRNVPHGVRFDTAHGGRWTNLLPNISATLSNCLSKETVEFDFWGPFHPI